MSNEAVNEYIASFPSDIAKMITELRIIVQKAAPEAEEVFSYKVPCYKLNGMLVAIGGRKDGSSFYGVNIQLLKSITKDYKDIRLKGSTLHFNLGEKIPTKLITAIVKKRVQENATQKANKQKTKLK